MGRILIEQDGKYIPSTDENIAGLSEPLGRGSSSLKKKVVRVGTRDGLPVYKLVPIDEPTPAPTARPAPEAPRPTPGPMSKAPDPYSSMTPIPEFNLGITGAELPTARSQGAMGATDPVAKAKAATAAAKAKQRGAVRAPLYRGRGMTVTATAPKKELMGPMNPSTDSRRRWEERYLRADAPKPEPLDLSLPKAPDVAKPDPLEKYQTLPLPADFDPSAGKENMPMRPGGSPRDNVEPMPEAQKPDPFEKYKPPVSSRESDLPEDDFSQNDQPGGEWVTTEGYQKNLKRPEGGDALGDTNVQSEPPASADENGEGADLEGKLDEAGGGMFKKRDFNAGVEGAASGEGEEPKKDWTSLYGGGAPGGDRAMERTDRTAESTQKRRVADQGLLLQAEGELYDAKTAQEKSLREMQEYIENQRGTDETQRAKFAQDRQNLIAKYTEGLDDTAKARFLDTLVKNVGKIVAGSVGLGKDLDVASGYRYEGADTEGMRKDVEGAYKAGVEDLEAREKERKGVADKEFERRQAILDSQQKLAQGHHQRVVDLLKLQEDVKTSNLSSDVMYWTPDRILREIDLLNLKIAEFTHTKEKDKAEAAFRDRELLSRILIAKGHDEAAKRVADTEAKAKVENKVEQGTKEEKEEEEKTNPEDVRIGRVAISEANNVLKWLNAGNSKDYVAAVKAGDTKAALNILRARLVRERSLAEQGKNEGMAKRLVDAISVLDQMTPHITSVDQVQDIVGTFNNLVADPATGLGATISGTRRKRATAEEEKKGSTTSVSGKVSTVIPKSTTPGKLTDAEIAGYQDVLKRSTNPKHREAAEKKLREAGLL